MSLRSNQDESPETRAQRKARRLQQHEAHLAKR